MARLSWDVEGERYFETGVDRGVLYVDSNGFAWPGLISVAESPSGGDPKPYYLDGIKYLNIAAAEEYEAAINAFYNPPEFNVCDGTVAIQTGLFATQQPRKSFGFSYRTRVGNDVIGPEFGYKVHLVYNALAAPANREYSSLSTSADPGKLSWSITTLAPATTGLKPTSHFIIDSRLTDPTKLASIEDILYGTDANGARLPSTTELVGLFSG